MVSHFKKRQEAKTMRDADYAADLAFLSITLAQVESRLHSLEQEPKGIGLYINVNQIEFKCFNEKGAFSTLSDKTLKFENQFTYLSSNISSAESDVNVSFAKIWNVIEKLSIMWKFNLSDKIKWVFFQAVPVSILLYGCITWTLTKHIDKTLDGSYTSVLYAILNKSWK